MFTSLPSRRARGTYSFVLSSEGFGRICLSGSLQYGHSLTLKLIALPQCMQILGGIICCCDLAVDIPTRVRTRPTDPVTPQTRTNGSEPEIGISLSKRLQKRRYPREIRTNPSVVKYLFKNQHCFVSSFPEVLPDQFSRPALFSMSSFTLALKGVSCLSDGGMAILISLRRVISIHGTLSPQLLVFFPRPFLESPKRYKIKPANSVWISPEIFNMFCTEHVRVNLKVSLTLRVFTYCRSQG